jgi:hypothetical protein
VDHEGQSEFPNVTGGAELLGDAQRERLRRLARGQRRVIIGAVVSLGYYPLLFIWCFNDQPSTQFAVGMTVLSIGFCLVALNVFATYQLTESLFGRNKAIVAAAVYVLLLLAICVFPFSCQIMSIVLSQLATNRFKRHGIRVGLLGADAKSI